MYWPNLYNSFVLVKLFRSAKSVQVIPCIGISFAQFITCTKSLPVYDIYTHTPHTQRQFFPQPYFVFERRRGGGGGGRSVSTDQDMDSLDSYNLAKSYKSEILQCYC